MNVLREKVRDLKEVWQKPRHLKSNVTSQKRHQNFDYTTIADRLRTVSWSNESHPTGVVKTVNGFKKYCYE